LPFLAYTQPRIARNLLRFRHSMLGRARERAREVSQRGALFPWRTINGEEASANVQAGTAQYHINADVAYAIRRYAGVRGDVGMLGEIGAEMLVETARLWEDLGFYGKDGKFHIHGVTGPDEYTTVVNDNTYTNLVARLNLNFAAATVRRLRAERPADHTALVHQVKLQPGEVESWDRAAEAMHVPFDAELGIHPQDNTFDYALLIDLGNLAGNASDGVHIASAAGVWSALVFGFGGVRDFDGRLSFTPSLPQDWDELAFSLRFCDRQIRVRLSHHEEQYLLDEGEPLKVTIRSRTHVLAPGKALLRLKPPPAGAALRSSAQVAPGEQDSAAGEEHGRDIYH
jgi:trehalose/maltose hydrolase-like predicted phosphorylase